MSQGLASFSIYSNGPHGYKQLHRGNALVTALTDCLHRGSVIDIRHSNVKLSDAPVPRRPGRHVAAALCRKHAFDIEQLVVGACEEREAAGLRRNIHYQRRRYDRSYQPKQQRINLTRHQSPDLNLFFFLAVLHCFGN